MPSVSRIHFIECIGNRPNPQGRTAADTHGRMGCSEWTGVPLSLLLDEAGRQDGAKWLDRRRRRRRQARQEHAARQGDRRRHGGLRPERRACPARPRLPLRLIVPGMEGIYKSSGCGVSRSSISRISRSRNTRGSWGRTRRRSRHLRLRAEVGHHLPVRFASTWSGRGVYVISGLAWSGGGAIR